MEDYEKKYKESLARARKYKNGEIEHDLEIGENIMEYVFPELKEPNDERIRKILINYFKTCSGDYYGVLKLKDIITWLEKQGKNNMGISETTKQELKNNLDNALEKETSESWNEFLDEQKPFGKVEPKFHLGDWVIDKQGIVHQIANVVENVTCHTYGYDIVGGGYFNDKTEGVRLWTIQDAKDGDVLVASDDSIFIFAGVSDCACKYYVALTNFNEVKINKKGECHYWETSRAVHPATKEQRETLFEEMHEAGYEWDAEKKELRKIEKKPAWSEEDEKGLGDALWCCKQAASIAKDENDMGNIWYAERWLKSIKERYTWKPSDEQMKALKESIGIVGELTPRGELLKELVEQLNELMEE